MTNEGEYRWSVSANAWVWVSPTVQSQLDVIPPQIDLATQEATDRGALYADDVIDSIDDEDGNVGAGLLRNGQFVGKFRGGALNEKFVDYDTSDDGAVIYGIRRKDGYGFVGLRPGADIRVFLKGEEGNRTVWASVEGRSPWALTPVPGDYHCPLVEGRFIKWIELVDGLTVEHWATAEVRAAPFAPTVVRVRHIIIYGQSENTGAYDLQVINSTPVKPGFATTFNSGVRNLPDQNPEGVDTVIADDDIAYLINLRETKQQIGRQIGETIASEVCRVLYQDDGLDETNGVLVSNHAIGGQSIERLSKGTVPYNNILKAVTRGKLLVEAEGMIYETPIVLFTQGVNNRQNTAAEYSAKLIQLQSDLTADINAITGGTDQVMFFIDQISSWTAYDIARSEVPFAQQAVSVNNPDKFTNACQRYIFEYMPDKVHEPAETAIYRASHIGRAVKMRWNGQRYETTRINSAVLTGTTIRLQFNVPVGPLVFDTTLVSDPGNYGIEVRNLTSGTDLTISSVTMVSTDEVDVVLASDPSGASLAVGVAATGVPGNSAGPTTGPRSCIRDSDPAVNSQNRPLHSWADIQLIPVTSA
ncbi:hypothetical protein J3U99_19990 [Brucella pituitosa]|uniref:hypothetical protein n=1 Tax=Brucella pituitosa TaxID=571256 RepID=UPI002005CC0F|nr:hypothetical protein [Brucella pituitosa]MCK4207059.1 hypothetical protein [Brucella pituitosa]